MKNIAKYFLLLAALAACDDEDDDEILENPADAEYNVTIDPADFESTASAITGNLFFPIDIGKIYIYEGSGEDGEQIRVTVEYTDQTKTVMGVICVVVREMEYEDEELVEDTYDWYAQDKEGNVWYFGEDSKEIEEGVVVGTSGSWEAGVGGALPGIIMLADPLPNLWYRQEYFKGEAEDVAQVLSTAASATVPYGSFTGCLQNAEWNLLEPGVVEHKFYAPGLGLVKAIAVKGESSVEELVEIQ